MQLNGSVFYSEYDDFQIARESLELGLVIANGGDAETMGLEAELSYSPVEDLVLMANYAYLDTEFTEGFLDGNDLAYAPENTFSWDQ